MNEAREGRRTSATVGGESAAAPDEALDAIAGRADLLHRCRVARAQVPPATLAEGVARHDDDLLLFEQPLAEDVVRETGAGDVREAVERTARLEAVQAHRVEAAPHELPPLVVRLHHPLDLRLAVPQWLERP